MSVAHDLRAPVDIERPEAPGICDRCGFKYPLSRLSWQYQWVGNSLQNIRLLVCIDRCLDVPAEFLRPIIIEGIEGSAGPNPRPYHYQQQMAQNQGPSLPFAPDNPSLPIEEPIQGVSIDQPNGPKQRYTPGFPGV